MPFRDVSLHIIPQNRVSFPEKGASDYGLFEFGNQKESGPFLRRGISGADGYPFQLGTTAENLAYAANGEKDEHDDVYPGFAEMARREGYNDAARLWMQIARIEGVHHNQFQSLEQQLTKGELTEKQEPIRWRCLNCLRQKRRMAGGQAG